VHAVTTTNYRYDFRADPQRFIDILRNGQLVADDGSWAADAREEDAVVDLVERRDWSAFGLEAAPAGRELERLPRRMLYRPVDWIGARKSVGDR